MSGVEYYKKVDPAICIYFICFTFNIAAMTQFFFGTSFTIGT